MDNAIDFDVLLRNAADRAPTREALKDSKQSVTWGELDEKVNQIAHALISDGVKPDDKVAILAQNSVLYALLFFGIVRAGGCAAPLSGLSSREALVRMVVDSQSKYLFIDEKYAADFLTDIDASDLNGAKIVLMDANDTGDEDAPCSFLRFIGEASKVPISG